MEQKDSKSWLPVISLVICLVTLIMLMAVTTSTQREAGYNARVLEENLAYMQASEENIEIYRVYVEGLRQQMIAQGLEVAPMPKVKTLKPIATIRKERGN